jgi:hypothetical protein
MRQRRLSTFFVALLVLGLSYAAQSADTQALFTIGTATDARSGELLYRELHLCTPERLSCTVEYRDVADELIAHKTLDYSVRLHAPVVVMRDLRAGKEYTLPVQQQSDVVVDAGFDNYVRQRWDALQRDEKLSFPLQLTSLERPVRMRAQALAEDCAPEHLCVLVEVDSWLLGLVADPIALRYARSNQRLLYFSGVSNIKSVEGDSQVVEIRYDYAAAAVPASSHHSLPASHSLLTSTSLPTSPTLP